LSSSVRGELENKVCWIVGATGTLGLATVKSFSSEGARLALSSRSGASVNGKNPLPDRTFYVKMDVGRWDSVQTAARQVHEHFGRIDAIVNCSGVQGPIGPTQSLDVDAWLRAVEINLFGCFYLARACVPLMIAQGGGKIVFLSGGGATSARPYFSAYGASKTAVVRLTETLAHELRDFNIQVNSIAPGAFRSQMWDEMRSAGAAGGQKLLDEIRQMDETGGVSPDRAAALAVFLASDRSGVLSGRLISAIHDKWEDLETRIPKVMSSDAGTLRRLPLD
jgi:NAD(P)-dependent dehydrogenase (short-subunit alcohol dehydrogenase family)